MINVYDNFLSSEDHIKVHEYVKSCPYYYGQVDNVASGHAPTGLTSGVDLDEEVAVMLDTFLRKKMDLPTLKRVYVNMFGPNEISHFHIDDSLENTYTGLYYANVETWDHQAGGETQFLMVDSNGKNSQTYGILPIPNRMVLFDSRMTHKATPFHRRHRWTIALKYGND